MSYTELESGYQDLRQQSNQQHENAGNTANPNSTSTHGIPGSNDNNTTSDQVRRHSIRPGFYVGHDGNASSTNSDTDFIDSTDGMDSDTSNSSNSNKQVVVGVCAMAKKTQSKPMKEIITRLEEFEFIKMVTFSESVILNDPVDKWPVCDCLISFHSKGFPLEKAIQYAQLRKPYVLNNLLMQYDIQDRRRVYAILEKEGIEIPRYAVLDRDSPDPKKHELIESEDHVEVNGIIFNKPFVEKPVSAEDHNIYIYYPTSAGGGSQRLFRKIGSRSSVYSPESRVRKTGSFIYEDFMPTDGTDVKVYTVGPDYAHAEARKSPALDGKVERDSEGKEIRYPVILNHGEKLISRKVCLAFKQTVCGFDLLRANGKSYVCDVNGFSFVKNSNKYYDDCAKILGNMILRELTPALHIPWSVPFQLDDPSIVPTTFGKMMELRCVVAVIRHGDRTPKQKMKVEVRHPKFFEVFEKYDGFKYGHIKLKRPKQLQEILDIARFLLSEIETKADAEIEEKKSKLEQLKSVLEMYGHFSGINRKVQMKYQPKGRPRGSSSDDDAPTEPSLVLILKWGGELTPAGRIQAEELGRIFRCIYPGGQGRHDYSGTQGLGLLRLHSTFRHDLKIYASDEGRVQMTAAAFAKGLLALEGELTPILVQMVKSANTNGLLDNDCDSSKFQNMVKNRLHELMRIDREFTIEDRQAINPNNSISINQALDFVKNPVECCQHVHKLIKNLLIIISLKKDDPKTKDAILYHGETWDLMRCRWEKIEKDFSTKSKQYDISKIPDIYDCIKYDLQHNQHTLQYDQAEELYIYAKYLADIVIPQEYGLTMQEKLTIGQGICTPLLKKIKSDLQRNIEEIEDESVNRLNPQYSHGVASPERHVRTRLYFTSESHVHSLLTVLRCGGLLDVVTDEQWRRAMDYISMVSELNYMSQIVIMLYEDPTKDPTSEERFHVELHFSPGVNCCVQKNLPPGPGFRPHSRNDSSNTKHSNEEFYGNPARIEEENDSDESPVKNQLPIKEEIEKTSVNNKCKTIQMVGSHHTVCGHEAQDLAKRLNEELASQQQSKHIGGLDANRPLSPDTESSNSRNCCEHMRERLKHKDSSSTTAKATTATATSSSAAKTPSSSSQAMSATSATASSSRRQRHSIAGQMSYMKMLGFGGFCKKMTTSTSSLFSTAVISGSSSAPNLREMIPVSSSVLEGFGGVPPIRPLETLHNALSLKQLQTFLEKMAIYRTPTGTPPKQPSTPLPILDNNMDDGANASTPTNSVIQVVSLTAAIQQNIEAVANIKTGADNLKHYMATKEPSKSNNIFWSKQSSKASSITEPSSPAVSDTCSPETASVDIMSTSLTSTDSYQMPSNAATAAAAAVTVTASQLAKFFPQYDSDLNAISVHSNFNTDLNTDEADELNINLPDEMTTKSACLTPVSFNMDLSTAANKGSLTLSIEGTDYDNGNDANDDDNYGNVDADVGDNRDANDDADDDDATPSAATPSLLPRDEPQIEFCYCCEIHRQQQEPPDDTQKSNELFTHMRNKRLAANLEASTTAATASQCSCGDSFSYVNASHTEPPLISIRKASVAIAPYVQKPADTVANSSLDQTKDYAILHGSINLPPANAVQLKQGARLRKFENLTQSTSNSNFPFESNTLKRVPNNVEDFIEADLTQSCINLQNTGLEASHLQHNNLTAFKNVAQSCSTVVADTPTTDPNSPLPQAITKQNLNVQQRLHNKTQSMDADFLFNEFVLLPASEPPKQAHNPEVGDETQSSKATAIACTNKRFTTRIVLDELPDQKF